MKRIFFTLAFVVGVLFASNAQEVGIRFGGSNGLNGAAVDGVFSLGEFTRVHADLAFWDGYMGLDAVWDFLYKPLGEESFNWYAGVGASTLIGNEFWLGATGELGIEYRFNGVPIVLGADWRPTFWIINDTKLGVDSFGLNVRWAFGK